VLLAVPAAAGADVPPPEEPSPTPPPPPPRTGSSAGWIALAAVIVVILLVVGLGFANVIPGFHLGKGKSSSGGSSSPKTYTVEFYETTLPGVTPWSVTLNGTTLTSTNYTIVFTVPNGTYPFTVVPVAGYSSDPASGTVHVAGAADLETLVYTAIPAGQFTVWFNETGLPVGTSWSVTLNGTLHSGTGSSISFTEGNGSFGFSVGTVSGYSAAPGSGTTTVDDAVATQNIVFTAGAHAIYFNETGLPASLTWAVTVGGTLRSLVTSGGTDSLQFSKVNGTYAYSIGIVAGWTQSTLPATGSVHVSGTVTEPTLSYTPYNSTVQFNESGITSGDLWGVTIQHVGTFTTDAPAAISVPGGLPNGTYNFAVQATGYTALPASGSFAVSGVAVYENIAFSVAHPPISLYNVTFSELGLPLTSIWELTVNQTPSALFLLDVSGNLSGFSLPNGTYSWAVASESPGYTASPTNGTLAVSGSGVNVTVTFSPIVPTATNYTVNFTETGLPSGTNWSLYFSTGEVTTNNSTVNFSVANGTYYYEALAPTGFASNETYGIVTVVGANVSVLITFVAAFPLTFNETGLPLSLSYWSVAVGNTSGSGLIPGQIEVYLPNGTYNFTVYFIAGYVASPQTGQVTVNGTGVLVMIAFTPNPLVIEFNETGLAPNTNWSVEVLATTLLEASAFNNTTSLNVSVPNGTYVWLVQPEGYYTASPATGLVVVAGANVTINVTFVPAVGVHGVEFVRTALLVPGDGSFPSGQNWTVTLGSQTVTSDAPVIVFLVPDGTYNFSITVPTGYKAAPSAGVVTVEVGSGGPSSIGAAVGVYTGPSAGPFVPVLSPTAVGPSLLLAPATLPESHPTLGLACPPGRGAA
jgi:hypothetical protein